MPLPLLVAGLFVALFRLTQKWYFLQARLSQDCMRAIMKMTYCPHCRGMASARPCANYCTNVMKGCLANQADLNIEWKHLAGEASADRSTQTFVMLLSDIPLVLVDTMMQVANHLHGSDGVEDAIRTLSSSISDAMVTIMENMDTVKNKVRVHFVTGCSWGGDKKIKDPYYRLKANIIH